MNHSALHAHCSDACDVPVPTMSRYSLTNRLKALFVYALRLIEVQRQRGELAKLSDQQLHDIGITREQAEREARRPFWDLPN